MNTIIRTCNEQQTITKQAVSFIHHGLLQAKNKYCSTTKTAAKSLLLALTLATVPVISHAANLAIGDKAPDFTVKTIDGKAITLSDYVNNKPVYLKFWATWCSYCKVEMPHLQTIYDENGEHIEVLTVNVGMNDSIVNIERFYQKNGFTLPTVFDKKGALTSSYGVVGTPFHVLIDKQGNIAYQTFLATDELDETILHLSQVSKSSMTKVSTAIIGAEK